ncbi:MAG: glycosyltransferase family 2 protein [Alphaproteobacteria bacterium]
MNKFRGNRVHPIALGAIGTPMRPLSFIIPAYNCQATVEASVASILDGNLGEGDEVVLVNDGSTDGTAEVLAGIAARCPQVRVVTHPGNRGGAAARNTAVREARHDLLFCLDSDNLLVPGSVAGLRIFLEAEGADAAAFREIRYFYDRPESCTHLWRFSEGRFTLADYLSGGVVPGASGNYLFTRASWQKAEGYPEFAGALDTWGFGLRQVATGQRMMVMAEGYYHHRYGHESYWVRDARQGRISSTAAEILRPFFDQLDGGDVTRITGTRHASKWFGDLHRHPIHLASGVGGQAGVVLDTAGRVIPPGRLRLGRKLLVLLVNGIRWLLLRFLTPRQTKALRLWVQARLPGKRSASDG